MPVATTQPITARPAPGIMVGSVYMPKQAQPTYAPKPNYKPTHTMSPAGLPSVIVEKPYKVKYDPTKRLLDQEAKERMSSILENYTTDSDHAATLLRSTQAALKASRELHEMERLSSMGLSHEQISKHMEKRLEENSHRHAKHHDSHTGIMEQINQLASSRGRTLTKLKQPMSTREGLMTPNLNFTQKEVNKLKHGLLHFAAAKTAKHLENMQAGKGENELGRHEAVERLKALEPTAADAPHRDMPITPAHFFTSPRGRSVPSTPSARTQPGFPTALEYGLLPAAEQARQRSMLKATLTDKGVNFANNAQYATLLRLLT